MTDATPAAPAQPQLAFCPRCGQMKPAANNLTLNNAGRGILFQGCADCLIGELDTLASYRSAQCNVCGALKQFVVSGMQPSSVQRLECPIHVHGRMLLSQALNALTANEESCEHSTLVKDIRAALGVKG